MKAEKYIRYSEITVFHFSAKRKKKYYGNIDDKKVSNNKIFWKTVKSFCRTR